MIKVTKVFRDVKKFATELKYNHDELDAEKKMTDQLLYQLFPQKIAGSKSSSYIDIFMAETQRAWQKKFNLVPIYLVW